MTETFSSVLWGIGGFIILCIIAWVVWTVLQIAKDAKEYLRDRIAYERGWVDKVANEDGINIDKFRFKEFVREPMKSHFDRVKDRLRAKQKGKKEEVKE